MRHQNSEPGLIHVARYPDNVALRKYASYNYITTCINIVPEVVMEILRWIVIMYRFEDDAVELGFTPGQIHVHVAGLILSLVCLVSSTPCHAPSGIMY